MPAPLPRYTRYKGGTTNAKQLAVPPDPQYPFFGAGAGQIFRFQVAASGARDATCHALLSFKDTMNMTLRVPPDPQKEVYLGPHQSSFFDLDVRALGVMRGQRLNFRPVLMYFDGSGPCFASFEVFEPFTARTLAMAHPPDPIAPAIPPPDDGFPVGLAFGQTLLLGVSRVTQPPDPALPPGPCKGELHFHAADGTMVGGPLAFDLAPGFAAFLSLNSSRLGLGFGQRAGIMPCWMPAEAGSTKGCKVSVQVLDNLTLWTTGMAAVQQNPGPIQ